MNFGPQQRKTQGTAHLIEQQGEAIFQASLTYALPGPDQGPKTEQIHRG